MSEMKQSMRFMWENKKMRRTFCCGFELLGAGGLLLLMTIAASIPLVMGLLGMDVTGTVPKWIYGLAVVFGVVLQELLIYVPYMIYGGGAGKGLGGIPCAKVIMTKGIIVNLMIFFVCGLVILLGIPGIGIALGVNSGSCMDDTLFLFGMIYCLHPLFQYFGVLMSRLRKKNKDYSGFLGVMTWVIMLNVFGSLNFSVPLAAGLAVAFFVCGTGLMYPALIACYKNRGNSDEIKNVGWVQKER